jgi:protein TonB
MLGNLVFSSPRRVGARRRLVATSISLVLHLALTAFLLLLPRSVAQEPEPSLPTVSYLEIPPVSSPVEEPRPSEKREPVEPPVAEPVTEAPEEPPELSPPPAPPAEQPLEVAERFIDLEDAPGAQAEFQELRKPEEREGIPEVEPAAPSARPEAFSGRGKVVYDAPGFRSSYYEGVLLAAIAAHWERPTVAGPLELVLRFRIQRDGTITDLRIERPSGVYAFDRAGFRAVKAASPVPPLPWGTRRSSVGVTLYVR